MHGKCDTTNYEKKIMQSIETTGRSIEEAKHKAASELGVPEQDLHFEVLDVGKAGILGFLGGSPARVRATYYESKRRRLETPQAGPRINAQFEQEEEEAPRRPSRRRSRRPSDSRRGETQGKRDGGREGGRDSGRDGGRDGGRDSGRDSGRDAESSGRSSRSGGRSRSQRSEDRPRSEERQARPEDRGSRGEKTEKAPRPEQAPDQKQARPAQDSGQTQERSSGGGRSRRRRPRRDQDERKQPQQGQQASTAGSSQQQAAQKPMERPENMEARANEAAGLLQKIVDAAELGSTVKVEQIAEDGFDLAVEGGQSDVLVNRQGQALDALQFLVGIMVNRKSESKVRVGVDAASFRAGHRQALEKIALDLADQVVEHNQEAELDPQPARDRLIIHNALKEHPKVYTYSEGQGDERHVVISPKDTAEEPSAS